MSRYNQTFPPELQQEIAGGSCIPVREPLAESKIAEHVALFLAGDDSQEVLTELTHSSWALNETILHSMIGGG